MIFSKTTRLYVLISSITCVVVVLGVVLYLATPGPERQLMFSPVETLNFTWQDYKQNFLETETFRTLDPQRDFITTSEGQSYTLLRAVWMDDKETFDRAFTWTTNNLGRPDDQLFSWLFGQRADGTYGVLTDLGGETSAIDADTDIAVALLFAYGRWREDSYLREARETINSIWEKGVVEINGIPYIAANDLEKTADKSYIIVNPSYLSPYAYRLFAIVDSDPTHHWNEVVDSSYSVINQSITLPLDKRESANLPPNWIVIDKQTGQVLAPTDAGLSTDYGFDAFRLPWRLALDWQWYQEPRARATLAQMYFLSQEWTQNNALAGSYSHAGDVTLNTEINALYAGSLGYFIINNPAIAQEIYQKKLASLYSSNTKTWKEELSYYDANWVWFGIALYTNQLPNLAVNITADNIPQQ